MALLLWILAVILVVSGIVSLVRGQLLMGIVLIIVGLLVDRHGFPLQAGCFRGQSGRDHHYHPRGGGLPGR